MRGNNITILIPTHIFRQVQYDIARGRSEPVEDFAFDIKNNL